MRNESDHDLLYKCACLLFFPKDIGYCTCQMIEITCKEHGIIVSNWNNYFEIINALAKHFKIINDDNEKSFILSNSELMNFALVPFTLKVDGNDIVLEKVEKEMATSEFDAFIETFVVNDVGL